MFFFFFVIIIIIRISKSLLLLYVLFIYNLTSVCFYHFLSPKPSLQSLLYQRRLFSVILCSSACLVFHNLAEKTQWINCTVLSQIMEKLVDIVQFLHLEIHEAFGSAGIFLNWISILMFLFIHIYIQFSNLDNLDGSWSTCISFIIIFF